MLKTSQNEEKIDEPKEAHIEHTPQSPSPIGN